MGLVVLSGLVGALLPTATADVPSLFVVAAAIGLLICAWLLVFTAPKSLPLWVLGASVLQAPLVIDLGVFVPPVYLVASFVALRLAWDGRLRRTLTSVDRAIGAMILLAVVSIPISFALRGSFPHVTLGIRYEALRPLIQAAALALSVCVFHAVACSVADTISYERALRFLVALGAMVAAYALYQQAATRLGFPLAALPRPAALSRGSLITSLSSGATALRSSATFIEPLDLGRFLIGTSAITLALRLGSRRDRPARCGLILALGIQSAAVVTTFSGGAYMGLAVALVTVILAGRRSIRPSFGGAALVIAMVGIAAVLVGEVFVSGSASPPQVLASRAQQTFRIETAPAGSAYTGYRRIDYWVASIRMLEDHPLTGVGIGNFGVAAQAINPALRANAGSYGAPWGFMGEFGVGGVMVFVIFVVSIVRTLYRAYVASRRRRAELLGFLAGLVGILVQYVSTGYWRFDPFTWAFLGLAVSGSVLSCIRQPERRVADA